MTTKTARRVGEASPWYRPKALGVYQLSPPYARPAFFGSRRLVERAIVLCLTRPGSSPEQKTVEVYEADVDGSVLDWLDLTIVPGTTAEEAFSELGYELA